MEANSKSKIYIQEIDSTSKNHRIISIPNNQHNSHFCSNRIKTSRYNLLTWVPKSLLFQFKRINNIYFLVISILSLFKLSPKNPWSLIGTFALVLLFTMFKEGYEDISRHRQDREVNRTKFLKFQESEGKFVQEWSENIRVGDVLKIVDNESLPSDILIAQSSDQKGVAFVNTMNLDGETNLKEKVAVPSLKPLALLDLTKDDMKIIADLPSPDLVKWTGTLDLKSKLYPLSLKNLLLRGCILKNTEFIIGIAIYTGKESKIVMNSKKPPFKSSNMQKKMNIILYTIFALQVSICVIFAGVGQSWLDKDSKNHTYLDLTDSSAGKDLILRIFTFLIAYSHFIPISLYVTVEIVKLFLAWLIENDLEMYYENNDKHAMARVSDLVEELGQVGFIFTDKTGTLTSNEMEFKKMWVNGQVYGSLSHKIIESSDFAEILDPGHFDYPEAMRFLEIMAICNSVFPNDQKGIKEYFSSSPDELALVTAAASLKVELIEKTDEKIIVKNLDDYEQWTLIAEIPFTSDRRRMSVIVKNPKGQAFIFTKGADTVMMGMISGGNKGSAEDCLKDFAKEGLRTLILAYRELEKNELFKWEVEYNRLSTLADENRDDLILTHAESIEKNMTLSGVSAVEDKLQDGVGEAIKVLIGADIKIWMLTGDKEETAIEIARSCELFSSTMTIFEIFESTLTDVENKIQTLLHTNIPENSGFVINGLSLTYVLNNAQLKENFISLALRGKSCVCCRVSPGQKMQVVHLGKQFTKTITLAIGDGANDVSMIQEAHIGIGISGKEGSQATQAAEFSLSQFSFLKHLLLHHGRLAYKRLSLFILYYFYKNFTSCFTEIWFALFNTFSGQIFFLDWLPQLYNTFWTSWPCLTICSLEQDLSREKAFKYPNIYGAGQKSHYFNIKRFWFWIFSSVCHSAVCFFLPVFGLSQGVDSSGQEKWLWWISTVSFIMLIHVVNLKIIIESSFWSFYSVLAIVIGVVLFYVFVVCMNTWAISKVFQPEMPYLFFEVISSGKVWIIVTLGPIFAVMPDFLVDSAMKVFAVSPITKMLLREKNPAEGMSMIGSESK